jgi:hypothetical protein
VIEPVRVGFSTTNAWLSRLIRKLSRSRVSHAFLVYGDVDFGRDMVMEAVGNGFRIVPYSGFEKHNTVVAQITPAFPIEKGLQEAVNWLGAGYDTGGLVGMAWLMVKRWFRLRARSVRTRNPLASSRALFCSEAVARACLWSEYPGFDLDPESTSPQDLLEFFERERDSRTAAPAVAAR